VKLVLLSALVIAVPLLAAASLDGSTVTMVSPLGFLDPSTTYTFAFHVDNGSYSSEYIRTIRIIFPNGLGGYWQYTMGFDEIVSGRPDFDMSVSLTTCTWTDSYSGGIHMLEDTYIWVDCTTFSYIPPGAYAAIHWELEGNWGSDLDGYIYVYTPVEKQSWGSIKAMFK